VLMRGRYTSLLTLPRATIGLGLGGLALGGATFGPPKLGASFNDRTRQRGPHAASSERTASSAAAATTTEDDERGRIGSIHRYPVKSCGGEQLEHVQLARLSPLPGDRRFLWVDSAGKFLTQRPYESRQGNDGCGVPKSMHAAPRPVT
jgi:hypothetical protein